MEGLQKRALKWCLHTRENGYKWIYQPAAPMNHQQTRSSTNVTSVGSGNLKRSTNVASVGSGNLKRSAFFYGNCIAEQFETFVYKPQTSKKHRLLNATYTCIVCFINTGNGQSKEKRLKMWR
jgi:hypothetical protein